MTTIDPSPPPAPDEAKSQKRDIVGAFSALLAIVEVRHDAHAVVAVFDGCNSVAEASARVISLPDLQFAGALVYCMAFTATVAGLIWGLQPMLTRRLGKKDDHD